MNRKAGMLVAGGAVLAIAMVAWACGPEFPLRLLQARSAALTDTPYTYFEEELKHLAAKPADALIADDSAVRSEDEDHDDEAKAAAEVAGLDEAAIALLVKAQAADTGDAAYAIGEGLPEAVRLYVAGAVEFNANAHCVTREVADSLQPGFYGGDEEHEDRPDDETAESPELCLQKAASIPRFEAVLTLSSTEQRLRATWAAYMLGRARRDLGQFAEAAKAFQRVRALALEGAPDPLHLAVASYGEEAGIAYRKGDQITATTLYAEQAARGSNSAVNSLRRVSARLFEEPKMLAVAIKSPIVQRLLAAYLISVDGRNWAFDSQNEFSFDLPNPAKPESDPEIVAFLSAIKTLPPKAGAIGADRIAAVAYAGGRFELANTLLEHAEGPFAVWVRAKLALQRGDLDAATKLYAELVKSLPAAGQNAEGQPDARSDWSSVFRIQGERGVLALARGEYVSAFEYLYGARDYWLDAAQVAEQVLTTDELKHFVDERVPARPVKRAPDGATSGSSWPAFAPASQLRDLLARRLMRDGRYAEAMPYFHAEGEEGFEAGTRKQASDFATYRADGEHRWTQVGRARARYEAAKLARFSGMEIMGYELDPDDFVFGGNAWDGSLDNSGTDEAKEKDKPFETDGERARVLAAVSPTLRRFHYRYVAVDLANAAADMVPPRSQAFAAILCQAASWDVDQETVKQVYRRYVKQGPYVPWAVDFGHACEEPDFDAASAMLRADRIRTGKRFVRHHLVAITTGLAALLGLALFAMMRWRRRKAR